MLARSAWVILEELKRALVRVDRDCVTSGLVLCKSVSVCSKDGLGILVRGIIAMLMKKTADHLFTGNLHRVEGFINW